ncbi:hypothetical protein, partial [Corynebacterium sp. KPL2734]|uniref:hypothetical protein n=1 Tax=Corynebacterium sp. KPL2734 TaxID=3158312 RepID=UPI0032EFEA94
RDGRLIVHRHEAYHGLQIHHTSGRNLSEVESCLTHLGIMDKGRLIANGTVNQVMQNVQNRRTIAYRTASNSDKSSKPWEQTVDVDQVPRIVSKLCHEGADDITISSPNLEDVFVNLIASKSNKA